MPWPEYEEIVEEFFRIASNEQWTDQNYDPKERLREPAESLRGR